ncbi:hypothetical protein VTJ04DRAFT_6160 [Mycothermus thermophilus]|uniref:uncharacterized protein n=1 Tax=Humicola insolens TaxID=85995 RepID=UPI0037437F02
MSSLQFIREKGKKNHDVHDPLSTDLSNLASMPKGAPHPIPDLPFIPHITHGSPTTIHTTPPSLPSHRILLFDLPFPSQATQPKVSRP